MRKCFWLWIKSHRCCALSSKPCFPHQPSFTHLDLNLHTLLSPHIHRPNPESMSTPSSLPSLPVPGSLRLVLHVSLLLLSHFSGPWNAELVVGRGIGASASCWHKLWLSIGTYCLCQSSYSHPIHNSDHFISIYITLWSILVLTQPYLRPDSPAHVSGLLIESKTGVACKMHF